MVSPPEGTAHFRAYERRAVRLPVELLALTGRSAGVARPAVMIDLSLAGAGLETDEPLQPGERVSITLATPTMWDPLVLEAVVAWAHAPRAAGGPREVDALGRSRSVARAGIAFDYTAPRVTLDVFEVLTTLGYE